MRKGLAIRLARCVDFHPESVHLTLSAAAGSMNADRTPGNPLAMNATTEITMLTMPMTIGSRGLMLSTGVGLPGTENGHLWDDFYSVSELTADQLLEGRGGPSADVRWSARSDDNSSGKAECPWGQLGWQPQWRFPDRSDRCSLVSSLCVSNFKFSR
jgi:hypothetical protein